MKLINNHNRQTPIEEYDVKLAIVELLYDVCIELSAIIATITMITKKTIQELGRMADTGPLQAV
jgi:hypothetical protein